MTARFRRWGSLVRPRNASLFVGLLACAIAAPAVADPQTPALAGYAEGGITSSLVATRAVRTSFDVQARSEQLRAAAAKLDEAIIQLLPRLGGRARYTRLSDFDPPPITGGSGSLVATQDAPGTVNPTGIAVAPPVVPNVLNNYLFQATLVVPLSDYPARLLPLRAAAAHQHEAAQYDLQAGRSRAFAEAKIVYYSWLRARGAEALAAEALAARDAHAKQAAALAGQGNISRPDELRAIAAVHAAKLSLDRAHELALLQEARVRLAMHASPSEVLVPGERLETPLPMTPGTLTTLSTQADTQRSDLRSLRAQTQAAEESATAYGAQAWPTLGAFGEVTYANPNPRRFPPSDHWAATWSVGVELSISLNDIGSGSARKAQESARARALAAQVQVAKDRVTLEVEEALRAIRTADDATVTSSAELENAREAHKATAALFAEGRAPSSLLADAEEDLTRADLELLNARVDARIGRVRLAYALGENTPDTAR